jgi:hypothetical protein
VAGTHTDPIQVCRDAAPVLGKSVNVTLCTTGLMGKHSTTLLTVSRECAALGTLVKSSAHYREKGAIRDAPHAF